MKLIRLVVFEWVEGRIQLAKKNYLKQKKVQNDRKIRKLIEKTQRK